MPEEGARVSLFQRITTPFGEPEEDDLDRSASRNAAGEKLRERRLQLRLDLDAVAEALRIKPIYLAAIEQGRSEELPGPTYASALSGPTRPISVSTASAFSTATARKRRTCRPVQI